MIKIDVTPVNKLQKFLLTLRNKKNIIYLIFVLIAFLVPLVENNFLLDMIFMIVLYSIMAEAWNMLTGYVGPVSLGHIVYFGLGAYTSSLLFIKCNITPWFGILLAGLVTMAVAGVLGHYLFRLKSHFFSLATVALTFVGQILAIYWRGLTGGSTGLLIPIKHAPKNMVFDSPLPFIYIALFILTVLVYVMQRLQRSKFGYSMIAVRENEDAAKALGIKPHRIYVYTNMLSSLFMAFAGTLFAQYMCYIDPETVISMDGSIKVALYAIIGGVGSIIGPLIGALIMVPIETVFRGLVGGDLRGLNMAIYGLVLIVIVIRSPEGFISLIRKIFHKDKDENLTTVSKERITNEEHEGYVIGQINKVNEKETVLEIKGLTKLFGGLSAVNDVNFKLKPGEVLGLIGPNGAGKTTTFNMITGFIPQTKGEIVIKGESFNKVRPWNLCKRGIVRTFQIVKPFSKLTVLQNVIIGAYAKTNNTKEAEQIAWEVLDFVGMSAKAYFPANKLTLSELKRIELARALATKPFIILLDEVMSGLTPKECTAMVALIKKIKEQNIAMVIVEHIMQVVSACCDRVIVLNFGQLIAEGTYDEVVNNDRVIEAYLGRRKKC